MRWEQQKDSKAPKERLGVPTVPTVPTSFSKGEIYKGKYCRKGKGRNRWERGNTYFETWRSREISQENPCHNHRGCSYLDSEVGTPRQVGTPKHQNARNSHLGDFGASPALLCRAEMTVTDEASSPPRVACVCVRAELSAVGCTCPSRRALEATSRRQRGVSRLSTLDEVFPHGVEELRALDNIAPNRGVFGPSRNENRALRSPLDPALDPIQSAKAINRRETRALQRIASSLRPNSAAKDSDPAPSFAGLGQWAEGRCHRKMRDGIAVGPCSIQPAFRSTHR